MPRNAGISVEKSQIPASAATAWGRAGGNAGGGVCRRILTVDDIVLFSTAVQLDVMLFVNRGSFQSQPASRSTCVRVWCVMQAYHNYLAR